MCTALQYLPYFRTHKLLTTLAILRNMVQTMHNIEIVATIKQLCICHSTAKFRQQIFCLQGHNLSSGPSCSLE